MATPSAECSNQPTLGRVAKTSVSWKLQLRREPLRDGTAGPPVTMLKQLTKTIPPNVHLSTCIGHQASAKREKKAVRDPT